MIRIGTRTSPLALAQTHIVIKKLQECYPELQAEIVPFQTQGDIILNKSLAELGGKGLFTKELEDALLEGRIDCAVHSLKDMPTTLTENLTIGAVLEREDPRDVFISDQYVSLDALPHGALVGTCSLRRSAFINHHYPHLEVKLLRGNVGTRIDKMKSGLYQGIILALAGLKRLGIENEIKEVLEIERFIPAPAQGVLGVECRSNDTAIKNLLQGIHHVPTFFTSQMERLFLNALGGSCKAPVAAYLHKTALGKYDFWYMLITKDQKFISDSIKNLNESEIDKTIQNIAHRFI